MWLLPRAPRRSGQRRVRRMMKPGVPFGRNLGGLRRADIHHPSPRPKPGARPALFVIDVAVGVAADTAASEASEQPGANVHRPAYTNTAPIGPPAPRYSRISTAFCVLPLLRTPNNLPLARVPGYHGAMRTNPVWHGVRLRHFTIGADPDAPPRDVAVPAGWDSEAASALAGLSAGNGPVRLPDAAELWIKPVARDPENGHRLSTRLHTMLLHRLGAPAKEVWLGQPERDPRFVLNLAACIRPGLGFDCECLREAIEAAVEYLTMVAPRAPCLTIAIADLAGLLAAQGIDYGSDEARTIAFDLLRTFRNFTLRDLGGVTSRKIRIGAFPPSATEALLGVETGGIAPAFSPVSPGGSLTRTARAWLAARGVTGEGALAAHLAGETVFPVWGAAAHAAMHDTLAPLLDELPARPEAAPEQQSITSQKRELPARHAGYTQKATIGGHRVYLRTGEHEDGSLGELSVTLPKDSPAMRGLMDAFATAVSLGLQYGVPLAEFVDAFTQTRFGPSGAVEGDPSVARASSIPDYVFRHLSANYLGQQNIPQPEAEEPPAAPPLLPLDLPADPRARRRGLRVVRS